MNTLFQSARRMGNRLRASRGHSLTMIGMLALGISSSTALFAVVNGIALRRLSLPDSERLVVVSATRAGADRSPGGVTAADLADLRGRLHSLDLAAFTHSEFVLAGEPAAERVIGAAAETDLFRLLRVRALIGRVLQSGEDGPMAARVVVLSYGLWLRRFGGDSGIVGRSIAIDGAPHTVVGVMPRDFEFPRSARMAREVELWTPLPLLVSTSAPRGRGSLTILGRLQPGVTLHAAEAEMKVAAAELAIRYPATNGDRRFDITPLRDQVVGAVRPGLVGMFVGVAILLAILCISATHLAVLRGISQTRGLAIRVAVGASPARALVPLLGESLSLAVIGGALGLAASIPLRSALLALAPDTLPRRTAVVTDWRVVAFAAVLSLVIGIMAGAVPIFRLRRIDLRGLLNESTRSATSREGRRWRDAFVLSEIALTTVLLAGGVSLLLVMLGLQRIDPGFRADGALTASVSIAGPRYRARDARVTFLNAYLGRIRAIPGVERAVSVNLLPIGGGLMSAAYRVDGANVNAAVGADSAQRDEAAIRSVSDDYFETVGQRLLRGRGIGTANVAGSQPVAVVNKAFVRKLGSTREALGTRIHIASGMIDTTRAYEVVGVVADAKEKDLRSPGTPVLYLSNRQAPYPYNNFIIRARGNPSSVVPQLRSALREIDPDLALDEVSSLQGRLRGGFAVEYFLLTLLSSFALLALLLVGVGVYGVVSRAVQADARTIGVRLALGAAPTDVMTMIAANALRLGATGAVIGAAGAVAAWRWAPAFASGVTIDRTTATVAVVFATVFMLGVCAAAALLPAFHAGRLDPMIIMRGAE